MTSEQQKKRTAIKYICEDIPPFEVPSYQGECYESLVPDTLELQERAAMAVNGLTGPTDPEADYEPYWMAFFGRNPPMMKHNHNDHVQAKFMESLPLLRLASGSDLDLHVERCWMGVILHMRGPDGLLYWPKVGRPWANICGFGPPLPSGDHYTIPFDHDRLIGAMTIYYLLTGQEVWKEAAERAVQGLSRLLVDKGTYAYFPKIQFALNEEAASGAPADSPFVASCAGWTLQGLAQLFRATGYEPAREMGKKLAVSLKDHSGLFGAKGEFEGFTHFHHHTSPLLGMMEYALATDDRELMESVRSGYEFGKANGEPLVGYFPGHVGVSDFQTSEICEVADMIAIGVKLAQAGFPDCWDDVDRWVRNQFAEGQLIRTDWIYRMVAGTPISAIDESAQTADRVPERNVGAFAGWPSANDWLGKGGAGIMHCCTGNGTRAIYYVWENILNYADGKLRVNLLLNRASPWADVDSYIPYEGHVDVKIKVACNLSIRIPEWVTPSETRVKVGDLDRSLGWDGRYAEVGSVKPSEVVTLSFPISERAGVVNIEGQDYTLIRKGNDVVFIDPPGKNCPLYQRAHYRENQVRLRRITRFVSQQLIDW